MDDRETPDEQRAAAARVRRAEDLDDFNNEIAGRETGRMNRFVPEGQAPKARQVRKNEEDWLSWAAAVLLQARFQQFNERLDELDRASLEALRASERVVREAQDHLDRIHEAATRDCQGRLVYRTADGRTGFYDNEQQLPPDEFDRVDWRSGAPTWEERLQAKEDRSRAVADRDAIQAYRERLGEVRERLGDGRPPDEDELAGLEAGVENMPDAVRRSLSVPVAPGSAAQQYMPDGLAAAPAVLETFNQVSAPLPMASGITPASTSTPNPLRR